MRAAGAVAPGAGRVDAECAVAARAGHVGLGHKGRRAVHVGGAQGAAGRERRVGLAQTGRAGADDDGRVVGACDVNFDSGIAQCAIAHLNCVNE